MPILMYRLWISWRRWRATTAEDAAVFAGVMIDQEFSWTRSTHRNKCFLYSGVEMFLEYDLEPHCEASGIGEKKC